jgi:hypothetical protein
VRRRQRIGGLGIQLRKALLKASAVSDPHEWNRAPRFEDFQIATFKDAPAQVNLSSNPIAGEYRTRIREAARKGPNFAGHFTVASWGWGAIARLSQSWML